MYCLRELFFDNLKYSIILFRYVITKPSETQSKFDKTYRLRWVKPKEHPFRTPALEMSLGMAIGMPEMLTFRSQIRVKCNFSFAE